MTENNQHTPEETDADVRGHLATALFMGVIVFLLVAVFALAQAA